MLKDTTIRNAKPRERAYKLSDGGGLYLFVAPASQRHARGTKSWRYDYRIAKRRETYTIGLYPLVSAKQARAEHARAQAMVARGESPSQARKREKQAAILRGSNTVGAIADDWYSETAPHLSKSWRRSAERWIETRIKPAFGSLPADDVEPSDVLALVRTVAKSHPKTAAYIRRTIARIYRYGIENGRISRGKQNPAREISGVVLPPTKHFPAANAKDLPALLRKVDAGTARPGTKLAVRALALTAVRKMELSAAKWAEFDFQEAMWKVPAARMKARREHLVPLSRQAVEVFQQLHALASGSEYVFPKYGDLRRPMGPTTINHAFEQVGIEYVPHSFRSTFSTWANERQFTPDAIERQLAHVEKNAVRATYNAAQYLPERRALMQAWADVCEGQADNVVNIGARRA